MKNTFEVTYFTGKSTRAYPATLIFKDFQWQIEYVDEEGKLQTIWWRLEDIHRNDTESKVNTFTYGEFPHQVIESREQAFADALYIRYPKAAFLSKS